MIRLFAGLPGGPVPVESHTTERVIAEPVAVPEVGLCWGRQADFEFDLPQEEKDHRANGGVTLRYPAETRTVERVTRMSPVWRRYDVMRVYSDSDPSIWEDVGVTREALLPVKTERLNYVSLGIGYVEDPTPFGSFERVVHTFLLLEIPPPTWPNAEKVGEGTVGEWPEYPEDPWYGPVAAGLSASAPGGNRGFTR